MNEYVDVKIEWFTEKAQFEEIPSEGIKFFTQIKFDEEGDKLPQWTAEIVITKSINKHICFGNLRYLFEHAPKHYLKKEKKFIVYDGPSQVAKGCILTDSTNA